MRAAFFGLFLLTSTAAAGCPDGAQPIRFGIEAGGEAGPRGALAETLALQVEFRMDGYCLETVEAGRDEAALIAALQAGEIDIAAIRAGALGRVSPRFLVYDLPFLFDDIFAILDFQNSPTGQALLSEAEGAGLEGLAFLLDGFRQLSANRRVVSPAEAAGLRVAVENSDLAQETMRVVEADPVVLAEGAVAGALDAGRVDAQTSSWSSLRGRGLHLLQTDFIETNHAVAQDILMVSTAFRETLDQDAQNTLRMIGEEVAHEQNKFAFERNEAAKYRMRINGSRIVELSPAQRAEWQQALQTVWFSFGGAIGFDQIAAAIHANALH